MFAEIRAQLTQSWNEEGFGSLYQALIICKIVDPYTSRSEAAACAEAIKFFKRKTARAVMNLEGPIRLKN